MTLEFPVNQVAFIDDDDDLRAANVQASTARSHAELRSPIDGMPEIGTRSGLNCASDRICA